MKIVVFGSHPDAKIQHGDVVYFVNASVQRRAEFLGATETRHVIGASGLRTALTAIQNGTGDLHQKNFVQVLRQATVDKTILVGENEVAEVEAKLRELGYHSESWERIPRIMKEAMTDEVTSLSAPVGVGDIFRYGLRPGLRMLQQLLRTVLRRLSGIPASDAMWPAKFRVSNGVFALVHAVASFGEEHEYLLCGIGLAPWSYGYRVAGERVDKAKLRGHVLADRKVLMRLRNLNISTDNETVSSASGIDSTEGP